MRPRPRLLTPKSKSAMFSRVGTSFAPPPVAPAPPSAPPLQPSLRIGAARLPSALDALQRSLPAHDVVAAASKAPLTSPPGAPHAQERMSTAHAARRYHSRRLPYLRTSPYVAAASPRSSFPPPYAVSRRRTPLASALTRDARRSTPSKELTLRDPGDPSDEHGRIRTRRVRPPSTVHSRLAPQGPRPVRLAFRPSPLCTSRGHGPDDAHGRTRTASASRITPIRTRGPPNGRCVPLRAACWLRQRAAHALVPRARSHARSFGARGALETHPVRVPCIPPFPGQIPREAQPVSQSARGAAVLRARTRGRASALLLRLRIPGHERAPASSISPPASSDALAPHTLAALAYPRLVPATSAAAASRLASTFPARPPLARSMHTRVTRRGADSARTRRGFPCRGADCEHGRLMGPARAARDIHAARAHLKCAARLAPRERALRRTRGGDRRVPAR
ncbi:hypothetical protein B0H15DRAFT_1022152 [Mycena belliarum]|uniref:Uncharacterized protein n=1 Tax=Mycena belliarum TaxID=1033014 RepID=A0AAD6U8X8_9AGAR|nr:hypothetical protein B0H15DRAFT_1022152 [Mycena belliae]